VVDDICGGDVTIPSPLQEFMKGTKQSLPMSKDFADFKMFLMGQ
jgi:threonine synthase